MSRTQLKLLAIGVLVVIVLGVGFLVLRPSPDKTTSASDAKKGSSSPQTNIEGVARSQAAPVDTGDFKYQKPAGWGKLTQEVLDKSGAVSGIGQPPNLAATLTIKVSDSTPVNNADLKESSLNELKKLSDFKLLSFSETKVDGKYGQKFIYQYGANDSKVKQELFVVPNKGKTFFLLFSSADSNFNKHASDFDNILSSFTFT